MPAWVSRAWSETLKCSLEALVEIGQLAFVSSPHLQHRPSDSLRRRLIHPRQMLTIGLGLVWHQPLEDLQCVAVAPRQAMKDAVGVVLSQALLQSGLSLGKGGRTPLAALDIRSELCVGVRQLMRKHRDGQVFDGAAEPLRYQADDAPVEAD